MRAKRFIIVWTHCTEWTLTLLLLSLWFQRMVCFFSTFFFSHFRFCRYSCWKGVSNRRRVGVFRQFRHCCWWIWSGPINDRNSETPPDTYQVEKLGQTTNIQHVGCKYWNLIRYLHPLDVDEGWSLLEDDSILVKPSTPRIRRSSNWILDAASDIRQVKWPHTDERDRQTFAIKPKPRIGRDAHSLNANF